MLSTGLSSSAHAFAAASPSCGVVMRTCPTTLPPSSPTHATPMMGWSTITHSDGDEGPSEDFGNDFCPDQTP